MFAEQTPKGIWGNTLWPIIKKTLFYGTIGLILLILLFVLARWYLNIERIVKSQDELGYSLAKQFPKFAVKSSIKLGDINRLIENNKEELACWALNRNVSRRLYAYNHEVIDFFKLNNTQSLKCLVEGRDLNSDSNLIGEYNLKLDLEPVIDDAYLTQINTLLDSGLHLETLQKKLVNDNYKFEMLYEHSKGLISLESNTQYKNNNPNTALHYLTNHIPVRASYRNAIKYHSSTLFETVRIGRLIEQQITLPEMAAQNGQAKILAAYLERGTHLTLSDIAKNYPIHFISNEEVIPLLLSQEYKSDPIKSIIALDQPAQLHNIEFDQFLEKYKITSNQFLLYCAEIGSYKLLALAINKFKVDYKPIYKKLLALSVKSTTPWAVDFLLSLDGNEADKSSIYQLDPNYYESRNFIKYAFVTRSHQEQWSPIHFYAATSNIAKLKEIIERSQSNINTLTTKGDTPLMIAIDYGSQEAIDYFISISQDLNAENNQGRNALQFSIKHLNSKAVKLLVDQKVSLVTSQETSCSSAITNANGYKGLKDEMVKKIFSTEDLIEGSRFYDFEQEVDSIHKHLLSANHAGIKPC